MSYRTSREKTLKVMQFGIARPSSASGYAVGSTFQITSTIQYNNANDQPTRYYYGNLGGLSLDTHTITDDTLVLPAGRYFIQSKIPVVEGYAHSNMTNQGFVEWQNYSANSLTGTYSALGTKGRNNPGLNPNHIGDDAGVHTYAACVVESNSNIYLQIKVVTNSNYTTLNTSGYWSWENKIMIWRTE